MPPLTGRVKKAVQGLWLKWSATSLYRYVLGRVRLKVTWKPFISADEFCPKFALEVT